jgi:hypothetical protein
MLAWLFYKRFHLPLTSEKSCLPNVPKKSLLVLCRKLSFNKLVIPKKSLGGNYLLLFAVAFSVAFYSQSLI